MLRNPLYSAVVAKRFIPTTCLRHIRKISTQDLETSQEGELNTTVSKFRKNCINDGFVWTSGYGKIEVSNLTLDQFVWKNMSMWHNKTALVCGVTGRSYTYGKLRDHCAAVAYRLKNNFKLKRGDVVAISLANIPEYAIVALGALEAGLTLATFNPMNTIDEVSRQLAMVDAKLIFSLVDNAETMKAACNINKINIPVIAIKTNSQQSIPDEVVDFANIMDTQSNTIILTEIY